MKLDEFDMDSLSEMFNVGLHRAAASLSEVTGQRILVDMPRLVICPLGEVEARLSDLIGGEVATVHQVFGGAVAGDAVLLLEHEKAGMLAALMSDGELGTGGRLDQSAREVLTEIGNIVLGACLSGFGDMLQRPVTFSVPRLHIDSLSAILGSLLTDSAEVQFAVIVATQFRLSTQAVDGYLIVALGPLSLAQITEALEKRLG